MEATMPYRKCCTPEEEAEALAAADRALAPLLQLFANAPNRPACIEYNLVVDADGGYRWVMDDVDRLIRKAIASAGKNQHR
jgi:hypothetical protein